MTLFRQTMLDGYTLTKDQAHYNSRYKYIMDENGEAHLVQHIISKYPCFNPDHAEPCESWAREQRRERDSQFFWDFVRGINETENMTEAMFARLEIDEKIKLATNQARARSRAKAAVFDLALCNFDFQWFVTWTLNGEKFSRYDYKSAVKNLGQWLDNRVRRNGLKYLIVPELHKDGALHFHGFVNDVISVVPSGTFIRPDGGKPVKLATLRRQHLDPADCREVFNLRDWQNGYTTAIRLYGERVHSAAYISKYITKTTEKVGGRYYLSGGDLLRPMYVYARENFPEDCPPEQMFDIPGNSFAIKSFKF